MTAKLSGSTGLEVPVPVEEVYGGTGVAASNIIVNEARTDDGEVATGTTVLPADDTIPQITEGDEFLTVSITPKNTANKLIIEWELHLAHTSGAGNRTVVALFQDATAGALTATTKTHGTTNQIMESLGSYEMLARTVSATTFKIRAGSAAAGTMTFNGISSSRLLGGVMNSYIKVTEVTP